MQIRLLPVPSVANSTQTPLAAKEGVLHRVFCVGGTRNSRYSGRYSNFGLAIMVGVTAAVASTAAPCAQTSDLKLELNKLEMTDKSCRAYLVVDNTSQTGFKSFKIDLVLFQTDGVISRRLGLDIAPVRPAKRTVKSFDLDGMTCDSIGSLLVNGFLDCSDDQGPVADCLDRISVSSRATVQLSK